MPSALDLSILFPAPSMDGEMSCVDIMINDDDLLEGSEFFTVSLEAALLGGMSGSVNLVSPSTAPVSITDNEGTFLQ